MPQPVIADEIVEAAVDRLLYKDTSYCDCRRSPFDRHDYNPPCETVREARIKMRQVLEEVAPMILRRDFKQHQANKGA